MLWPIYENVALLGEGGSFRKCGGSLGDVVAHLGYVVAHDIVPI